MSKRGQPKLRQVIAKHGYRCWYCRVFVMPVVEIPNGFRLRRTHHWIEWYDPIAESVANARIMTVDHRVALCNGGTNELRNLVPACVACNGRKANREKPFEKRKPRNCRRCGVELFSKKKMCLSCHEKNKAAWFARATD